MQHVYLLDQNLRSAAVAAVAAVVAVAVVVAV